MAVGMNDEEVIDAFADLFAGNPMVYGTEEGGCADAALSWREIAEAHLRATLTVWGENQPIGVYPIWETQVKWGCVDFDLGDEESLVHARNVCLALQEFGITGHIERSRSKGMHAWVFAASWGAAGTMREALLAACQLVDAPTSEINPKQSELSEGQVGNYVRACYPGALANGGLTTDLRRVMIGSNGAYTLRAFLSRAMANRASWDHVQDLAALYKHSANTRPIVYTLPSEHYSGDARDRMKPLTKWIYDHGPADRSDRSSALWKFACLLAEDGRHTYKEARSLLTEADERWGKFMARSDGELRLDELLDKAWRDRATAYEVGAE